MTTNDEKMLDGRRWRLTGYRLLSIVTETDMSFGTEMLVEVWRGGRVESEHRGAIAVVDAQGRVLAHIGDVGLTTYLRSSAKPFQLLPLIESGAADRLDFTDRELAVIAGSHSGEPRHLEAVQSILNKIGLSERCAAMR